MSGAISWITVLISTPAGIGQLIPWRVQKSSLKVANRPGRIPSCKNAALNMEPVSTSSFSFPERFKVKVDPGMIALGETDSWIGLHF